MDPRVKLCKDQSGKCDEAFQYQYLEKFRSLNYLPTITRPDIAYAVSVLGRYNANPTVHYIDAAARVFSYLISIKTRGLVYRPGEFKVDAYADVDWQGCIDTRRSTTGQMFTIARSPVSWSSKRQATVVQSTCEAKYVAGAEAVKEAIQIKRFINDLQIDGIYVSHIPLYVDNTSAIKLIKNAEDHQYTKYIDTRHYFIRECVQDSHIVITSILGADNPVDILIKPLGRLTFERYIDTMGMTDVGS